MLLASASASGPHRRTLPGSLEADIKEYRNNTPFDRDPCYGFADMLIRNSIIESSDPAIFALDKSTGRLLNTSKNMALTYGGCEAICGPQTFYTDAGPRFMTWILPSKHISSL